MIKLPSTKFEWKENICFANDIQIGSIEQQQDHKFTAKIEFEGYSVRDFDEEQHAKDRVEEEYEEVLYSSLDFLLNYRFDLIETLYNNRDQLILEEEA